MHYPGSLHNHTDYSNIRLRDSINKVEEIIDYAIELGHKTIAITEHDCLSNTMRIERHIEKIKESHPDFKVVRGNEIYLCRDDLTAESYDHTIDRFYHFILLAVDSVGAKQMGEISTNAWLRSFHGRGLRRVPTIFKDLRDIIGANKGHVIGTSACLGGQLSTLILQGQKKEAVDFIKEMVDIFGEGNFYLEMQPSHNEEQILVNQTLLKISAHYNIPYLISLDAHYLKKEDASIHAAYLNSQSGDREVEDFYASTYMMDTQELESYFDYLTQEELEKAYTSTLAIAERCEHYSLKKPLKIPQLSWKTVDIEISEHYFEKMPFLRTFNDSDFEGDRLLARTIVQKIESDERLQDIKIYERVEEELGMTWESSKVNNANWSSYFLNLQKIIDTCWEAGTIVGPARGSGAGFLLLYLLDIIQVNPVWEKVQLYPWRFLNPARVSVLDVDIDISGLKRSEVLDEFRKRYGEDRVSSVATFAVEKSKSAIKTAARGLGIDNDVAQYIADLIPSDRGMMRSLHQCYYGDEAEGHKPVTAFVREMKHNFPELWKVAQKIEGLVCRLG